MLGRVDYSLWPGRALRPGFLTAGGRACDFAFWGKISVIHRQDLLFDSRFDDFLEDKS